MNKRAFIIWCIALISITIGHIKYDNGVSFYIVLCFAFASGILLFYTNKLMELQGEALVCMSKLIPDELKGEEYKNMMEIIGKRNKRRWKR